MIIFGDIEELGNFCIRIIGRKKCVLLSADTKRWTIGKSTVDRISKVECMLKNWIQVASPYGNFNVVDKLNALQIESIRGGHWLSWRVNSRRNIWASSNLRML